jgi:hypothetical protein
VLAKQKENDRILGVCTPSSTLLLLTIMQAEIPGQEQDGYDAEPNFFHGMHQVRATADPSSFYSYSVHYSILKIPDHELNNALGVSKSSGSPRRRALILLHQPHLQLPLLPPSEPSYDTYSPGHPIMQRRSLSMFLLLRVKRCVRSTFITVFWASDA